MSEVAGLVLHFSSAEPAVDSHFQESKEPGIGLLENVLDAGVFDEVLGHFDYRTLVKLLQVCHGWRQLIDPCESIWRPSCQYLWADKEYVPRHIRALAQEGNDATTRLDLRGLSEEQLQTRARQSMSRTRLAECISLGRDAVISSIIAAERDQFLYPGEPLAKRALRLSLEDATRRVMTQEELMSFEWSVRIRSNGPLAPLAALDPWWTSTGVAGKAWFRKALEGAQDREVHFAWPPGRDPFEMFNINLERRLEWMLTGPFVKIYVGGQWGHFQNVARHPVGWGWLLINSGTVWTSWAMPDRGHDVFIEDDLVNDLVPGGAEAGISSDDEIDDEENEIDEEDASEDEGAE